MRYHHQNCPDRAGVEAELYHFGDVHPAVRPVPVPAARGPRAADQRAEDWEKEANVKKTYDARKASTKKTVMRKIEGATPSERREFREKEKQRHARLEQGLSSEDDLEFDPTIPGLGRKEGRVGSSSRGGILRRPSVVPQSDSILDQLMRLHLGRGKVKKPGEPLRRPGEATTGDGAENFTRLLSRGGGVIMEQADVGRRPGGLMKKRGQL